MKIAVLKFVLGVVCAIGVWAMASTDETIEEIVRRGGRPFPPGEP
jgi:hypothetical protein